jgi:hypothetical protein
VKDVLVLRTAYQGSRSRATTLVMLDLHEVDAMGAIGRKQISY